MVLHQTSPAAGTSTHPGGAAGITKTGVKTTTEKTKEILLKQMELLQEKSEQVEDLEDLCKLSDCIARIAQLAPCLV